VQKGWRGSDWKNWKKEIWYQLRLKKIRILRGSVSELRFLIKNFLIGLFKISLFLHAILFFWQIMLDYYSDAATQVGSQNKKNISLWCEAGKPFNSYLSKSYWQYLIYLPLLYLMLPIVWLTGLSPKRGPFYGKRKDFSPIQTEQTGPGSNPASYSVRTGGLFLPE
jgi:hypothetical protein